MSSTLADRVRSTVDGAAVREVRMFGGLAFMIDNRMVVWVQDETLLVRANPADAPRLLTEPGASPAEMGEGRRMGAGWITVAPDAVATAEGLRFWMDTARAYHRHGRTR